MKNTKAELNDTELENVSGGERFNNITIGDITGTLTSKPLDTEKLGSGDNNVNAIVYPKTQFLVN